jgi:hypothetical protein
MTCEDLYMMKFFAAVAALAALFAFSAGAEGIEIYPAGGFYEGDITVEVKIPEGEKAYYSLDGTTQNGRELDGKIEIEHTEGFTAHTLRVWTESGLSAGEAYITGAGVDERFDMYVAVIDTTDEALHDYETGILEEGKVWADYDAQNPDNDLKAGKHPANYNQRGDEWVRDAYVTVFDRYGNELISQAAGLSVMGSASSKQIQKSLKVSADEEYDPDHDDFVTDIFVYGDSGARAARSITEFNNLVFRNAGNDYNQTWFRWNFLSELAVRAGFEVVQPATPCVLFLNGRYYGMTQLQPTASRKFVGDCVGISDQDNIEVLKTGDQKIYDEAGIRELVEADFTDPANVEALNGVLDIDQFIRYCAFQTIANNCDWPSGNVYMWRYTGDEDPANPMTDGRWRYVLYDLDYCYDVYDADGEIFDDLWLNDNAVRSFFKNLMQVDELRSAYLADVYQLLNQVFVEDDMLALINELDAQVIEEVTVKTPYDYIRDRDHAKYVNMLVSEVMGRRSAVGAKLAEYLDCKTGYVLSISDPGVAATITVSGTEINSAIEGINYVEAGSAVACNMHAGWEFRGWTVNGETITDAEFVISPEMAASGSVEITLEAARIPSGPVIWAIAAKDDDDFIEIMNPGSTEIYLGGMYVSDDPENPGRQQLPGVVLASGESITLGAEDSDYELEFGLKKGETVLISGDDGAIYDAVQVPRMELGDVYARYGGGQFSFYRRNAGE